MHLEDKPHQPRALVILLPDAPGAGGNPHAAVPRPGLPPLVLANARGAAAEARAREARP
jgi:hypothetical protein